MTGDQDRAARDEHFRQAMLEKARQALMDLVQQLDKPGGSRVVADWGVTGDPDTMVIRIEIPLGGKWITLTSFHPSRLGRAEDDIAEDLKYLGYQVGIGIPDDLSSLDQPGDND